jgi:DNA-binding HxlR family transcriptional regulator
MHGCSPVPRCRRQELVPEDVRRAADVLERRYAVSIIYASHHGCTRFTEFRHALGTIPPATLAQRLGELERAGVLRREVRDTRPPHVEYLLTPEGRRLEGLLAALATWARAEVRP